MKKRWGRVISLLCAGMMVIASVTGCGEKEEETASQTGFIPSLDTEKAVSLEIAGFMGNFEALDQVVNDFNEYYPNVSINYEQNNFSGLAEYLKNNDYVDIFMTSIVNMDASTPEGQDVLEYCLDLSKEDIATEIIDPQLVEACTVDGQLVGIPLAKLMCGMVVNKNLLEEEGLKMPQNYAEFLKVCETLKEKGYTPIQASRYHACSDMILPMAMVTLGTDEKLAAKASTGDKSYADALLPVYERLEEMVAKGYISNEVNETYPDDNYDGAILTFFEGKVPFWIANTESVSGMKKRESKSETFLANPFEYEFVNVPLGDKGVYDYEEPWYGFSINRNSEEIDYAVEFMKFLVTEDELNKMAESKGMPSVTLHSSDSRFEKALNPEKCEGRYVYNGVLDGNITGAIADAGNHIGQGDIQTAEEAVEEIKNR